MHCVSRLHLNFRKGVLDCQLVLLFRFEPFLTRFNIHIGPVYKTNLVRTKSLSDHGPDQIWLCKRYLSVPKIWSGPKSGPAHVQGPRSDRIWSCAISGYVNAPCLSDQTKSLTFGGKSQSSNKNGESATWCKLVSR